MDLIKKIDILINQLSEGKETCSEFISGLNQIKNTIPTTPVEEFYQSLFIQLHGLLVGCNSPAIFFDFISRLTIPANLPVLFGNNFFAATKIGYTFIAKVNSCIRYTDNSENHGNPVYLEGDFVEVTKENLKYSLLDFITNEVDFSFKSIYELLCWYVISDWPKRQATSIGVNSIVHPMHEGKCLKEIDNSFAYASPKKLYVIKAFAHLFSCESILTSLAFKLSDEPIGRVRYRGEDIIHYRIYYPFTINEIVTNFRGKLDSYNMVNNPLLQVGKLLHVYSNLASQSDYPEETIAEFYPLRKFE